MSFDLATILREAALAHPGRPLLHAGPRTLSYGEVDAMSGRMAAGQTDLRALL